MKFTELCLDENGMRKENGNGGRIGSYLWDAIIGSTETMILEDIWSARLWQLMTCFQVWTLWMRRRAFCRRHQTAVGQLGHPGEVAPDLQFTIPFHDFDTLAWGWWDERIEHCVESLTPRKVTRRRLSEWLWFHVTPSEHHMILQLTPFLFGFSDS